MSGTSFEKGISFSLAAGIALAIGGLVATVLFMGSPSHHGESRTGPHSTADRMDKSARPARMLEASRDDGR
jgi:hypothetical protein